MFKMGCSMARKILASSSGNQHQAGQSSSSNEAATVARGKAEEINDFSKLEQDPRIPLNVWQIFKITKSWKAIARTMSKTGTAMFLNLFEQNKDLFYLFDRFQHLQGRELHESMELKEHAATVMSTLDQSINSLSDYDNFVSYLHSIGELHRKVPGFKREHFWKIEQPFMRAIKQTLDERCNETIEEIYKIAIKLIIETIAEGYGQDSATSAASSDGRPGSREDQPDSSGSPDSDGARPGAHHSGSRTDKSPDLARSNQGDSTAGRQHASAPSKAHQLGRVLAELEVALAGARLEPAEAERAYPSGSQCCSGEQSCMGNIDRPSNLPESADCELAVCPQSLGVQMMTSLSEPEALVGVARSSDKVRRCPCTHRPDGSQSSNWSAHYKHLQVDDGDFKRDNQELRLDHKQSYLDQDIDRRAPGLQCRSAWIGEQPFIGAPPNDHRDDLMRHRHESGSVPSSRSSAAATMALELATTERGSTSQSGVRLGETAISQTGRGSTTSATSLAPSHESRASVEVERASALTETGPDGCSLTGTSGASMHPKPNQSLPEAIEEPQSKGDQGESFSELRQACSRRPLATQVGQDQAKQAQVQLNLERADANQTEPITFTGPRVASPTAARATNGKLRLTRGQLGCFSEGKINTTNADGRSHDQQTKDKGKLGNHPTTTKSRIHSNLSGPLLSICPNKDRYQPQLKVKHTYTGTIDSVAHYDLATNKLTDLIKSLMLAIASLGKQSLANQRNDRTKQYQNKQISCTR